MAAERLESLEQVRAFVEGSEGLAFSVADRSSRNDFVRRMLVKFDYGLLGKADKGLMKRFLGKAAGLSRAQLTRLIGQRAKTGRIVGRRVGAPSKPFVRRYTARDVVLPAQVDETLGQVCGQATRAVMRREFGVFGDAPCRRVICTTCASPRLLGRHFPVSRRGSDTVPPSAAPPPPGPWSEDRPRQ